MTVACNTMGADRRSEGAKNDYAFSGTARIDAPDMKTGEHRIYTRACGIFHPRSEVVNARKRPDIGSARGFVLSFLETQDQGATLRIGERDDFPEQTISGIRGEVAAR